MRFLLIHLFAILILSACKSERWDNVVINPDLAQDTNYQGLDRKIEYNYNFATQKPDTIKGSSDVDYKVIGDSHQNKFSNRYKCTSYFSGDTLRIDISIGNGHAGDGFIINYLNNRFYTEPYLYSLTLNGVEGSASKYNLVQQSLVLDKLSYQPGDSLWGKVEFKSIEISIDNKKIEHVAKGYFRTKIKEL